MILSKDNSNPVGKNCENSIITVRTMKYVNSVRYIPLYYSGFKSLIDLTKIDLSFYLYISVA